MDSRAIALAFSGKPHFVPHCVAMPASEETACLDAPD
jgi:hypothetical protein